MSKYLLTHGHFILDARREYIDGALLFEDNKILDVFPHLNKTDRGEYEEIDLRHQLVFPYYVGRIDKSEIVIYDPKENDSLSYFYELCKSGRYVAVKDTIPEMTGFLLKNISRHKAILIADEMEKTMTRLHENGIGLIDLSLMTCGNIEHSQGRENFVVKGNKVNFVIMDNSFHPVFRIINGEFIYDQILS